MTKPLTFAPTQRAFANSAGAAPFSLADVERAFDPSSQGEIFWTSTARSALRAVLLHLRQTGILRDKNAEMLVPRWACTSLYNTMHKVCFPTIQDSPALRGVLAYHQYGFPQRLDVIAQRCRDRGLFLIENCVNCAFDGSSPHGMGETGLASIFSLPKMFRTVLGGVLISRDSGLSAFCIDYFREDEPWIGGLSRTARRLSEIFPGRGSQYLQEMVYGISDFGRKVASGDIALLRNDFAAGAAARRKENYTRLRQEFVDTPFFVGLEPDVIPYVAPLFGPPEFLARLSTRLSELGWESGIYHFDAARDVFSPDFVACVPLPVHQGLSTADMDTLVETIRFEWRSHNGQR